ncbi:ATP-binding protein [Paenibacillus eucommiae]|uniref:histidine kinase n=1 Tax=Paenibacillus eucommiae TaxID=1355755 RepID=A0ABS4J2D4_9BACL|nr:ATP-binding protein [Paenibacillus eucommiae]MBP1993994.1 two-component system chemotaxis sensor kinase CheA [Paenibacillus eucommiae]
MNFKRKQFLGLSITLVLMLALMSFVIIMMNSINKNTTEIVDDRYKKLKNITEFHTAFSFIDSELGYLINEQNSSKAQEHLEAIQDARQVAAENMKATDSLVFGETGKQLLAKIQFNYTEYSDVVKQLIVNMTEGNSQAASYLFINAAQESRNALNQSLKDFKDFQENLMNEAQQRSKDIYSKMLLIIGLTAVTSLIIGTGVALWLINSTSKSLNQVANVMNNVDFNTADHLPRLQIKTNDEIGKIAMSFNEMASSLEAYNKQTLEFTQRIEQQNWIQTRIAEVSTMSQGFNDITELAQAFVAAVSSMLNATHGVFYILQGYGSNQKLVKLASFAGQEDDPSTSSFLIGEGLVGQCAKEKRVFLLNDLPDHYIKIASGLGQSAPKSVLISPLEFESKVEAVIEFASLENFTPLHQILLENLRTTFGTAINRVCGRMEVERLLLESQALTEELQSQSEELQTQTEELQSQAEELQMQQEELRSTNEILHQQHQLDRQKTIELEVTKRELEEFSEELKQSSKYKSEFLANMSHELRTPLNSILILSQMLAENQSGTLTPKEQEYSSVIHHSGQDLLTLIDDILDLSKVEAGKVDLVVEDVNLYGLPELMNQSFEIIAQGKGVSFETLLGSDIPEVMKTDGRRLQQILKNLLSNAFKFTEQGKVTLKIDKADPSSLSKQLDWQSGGLVVSFSVTDTGIGIPEDKQSLIFEAFQQVDGTTNRTYGGTGLGLSICREFAKLMGGYIDIESEENKGSTFTLYVPHMTQDQSEGTASQLEVAATASPSDIADSSSEDMEPPGLLSAHSEYAQLFKGKKVLLVDDDVRNLYALTIALENEGMLVRVAGNGRECLDALYEDSEVDLILMDIMMPVMDGYEAMHAIRHEPNWGNIPIITLTAKAMKNESEKCLEAGASDYISKPLNINQLFSLMRVWLTK